MVDGQLVGALGRIVDLDPEAFLQVRSVKAYYDASLGSRGAKMMGGYTDEPAELGESGAAYGFVEELVARQDHSGLEVRLEIVKGEFAKVAAGGNGTATLDDDLNEGDKSNPYTPASDAFVTGNAFVNGQVDRLLDRLD